MLTLCPDTPDTSAYYAEVARRFEELADYLRSHPEIDRDIANHLKDLADGILRDVGSDRSKVLAA